MPQLLLTVQHARACLDEALAAVISPLENGSVVSRTSAATAGVKIGCIFTIFSLYLTTKLACSKLPTGLEVKRPSIPGIVSWFDNGVDEECDDIVEVPHPPRVSSYFHPGNFKYFSIVKGSKAKVTLLGRENWFGTFYRACNRIPPASEQMVKKLRAEYSTSPLG